jgi:hypothetical protein
VLLLLGMIAFALAMIDGVGVVLGHHLTDVSWSPLLFAFLGLLFVTLEAGPKADDHPAGSSNLQ